MADNVGYTPGSGALIAADDIGGNLHQRIKLVLGADGVSDGDVSAANPMPVSIGSQPLPTGAATEATLAAANAKLPPVAAIDFAALAADLQAARALLAAYERALAEQDDEEAMMLLA